MSSIRNLLDKPFDELVGVIFKEDFEVDYAARIPYAIIVEHSAYKKHTNSHIFHFRRSILELPEVIDLSNHF